MRWRLKAENVSGMSSVALHSPYLRVLAKCLGEGLRGLRRMKKREHHDHERALVFLSAGKEK